jgi:hypothetical protein
MFAPAPSKTAPRRHTRKGVGVKPVIGMSLHMIRGDGPVAPTLHGLYKTTFNAETAETAEKDPTRILGDLCVLCVKTL